MTWVIIGALWFTIAFLSGYVIGSILRERDRDNDAEYVELIPPGKDFL